MALAGARKIRKLRVVYAICFTKKCLANVFTNLKSRRLDDSDTRCYKLRGLTDQSTEATTPVLPTVPFKAKQWQLLTEGRLCSLLFAEI